MINFRIIYKILGALLYIEASMMVWCLLMALYFGEDDTLPFAISIVVTILAGIGLRYVGRKADNILSRRDSFLVVTLVWVVFSAFGTMPFLLGGYLHSFTDAFFETMSGFTTTGATIIDNVEALPHGILFWRSMTQWIGGLGIVFFTVALLPSLVGGSTKVFAAESTGPIKTKLHPKLSMGARWIWIVYLVITFSCMSCYMIFGMNWFEAINYSMTTSATGGFAVNNSSTLSFQSPALDYTTTFFCFISGVNFTLLYFTVAKLKFKELWKDSEFQFYCLLVLIFTVFIMAELVVRNHYDLEHAFRSSIFQVVSFITTTGLFNDDAAKWPHVTWVVLSICMFIGACSGSTSGGLKCMRGVMLTKVMKNEIHQRLHPNAVLPLKINGNNIPINQRVSLLAFFTTYLLLLLIIAFIMIAVGIDNTNAITICLSSLGNVGPTLGLEIGPTMSWSILPDVAKWLCSFMMLVGRLEIFTVLVILTPSFWTKI
ncbi:MAG: TrkH family potassium uptake protein [Prevotella sp.]|nr:TrkH family potassium uptake protein [Prevotella sp.]